MADSQLFALQLPRLPPGKIFPIPDVPAGASPATLVLLAGLVAGAILAGLGDESKRPRKPHQDKQGKKLPDNIKVLKVFDAVDVIETALITDPNTQNLLTRVILKSFTKIFTVGHATWHDIAEMQSDIAEVRREVWEELADYLQSKIREAALQQANARFRGSWVEGGLKKSQVGTRTIYSQEGFRGDLRPFTIRQGKLHGSDKKNFDL